MSRRKRAQADSLRWSEPGGPGGTGLVGPVPPDVKMKEAA